jgi:hypothetical protein
VAGELECKKRHQKAAHRKLQSARDPEKSRATRRLNRPAGFYAVSMKSQRARCIASCIVLTGSAIIGIIDGAGEWEAAPEDRIGARRKAATLDRINRKIKP